MLARGRSTVIGLLVSDITNPFFPDIVKGVEDLAKMNHFDLLLGGNMTIAGADQSPSGGV